MSRLTTEDLAQELIDQAWEAEDDVERLRLVLRALARYPDHADGDVLLARQVAGDPVAMRTLHQQGIAAVVVAPLRAPRRRPNRSRAAPTRRSA